MSVAANQELPACSARLGARRVTALGLLCHCCQMPVLCAWHLFLAVPCERHAIAEAASLVDAEADEHLQFGWVADCWCHPRRFSSWVFLKSFLRVAGEEPGVTNPG